MEQRRRLTSKGLTIVVVSVAITLLIYRGSTLHAADSFLVDALFITAMGFIVTALGQVVRTLGLFNGFLYGMRALGRELLRITTKEANQLSGDIDDFDHSNQARGADTYILLAIGFALLGLAYLALILTN